MKLNDIHGFVAEYRYYRETQKSALANWSDSKFGIQTDIANLEAFCRQQEQAGRSPSEDLTAEDEIKLFRIYCTLSNTSSNKVNEIFTRLGTALEFVSLRDFDPIKRAAFQYVSTRSDLDYFSNWENFLELHNINTHYLLAIADAINFLIKNDLLTQGFFIQLFRDKSNFAPVANHLFGPKNNVALFLAAMTVKLTHTQLQDSYAAADAMTNKLIALVGVPVRADNYTKEQFVACLRLLGLAEILTLDNFSTLLCLIAEEAASQSSTSNSSALLTTSKKIPLLAKIFALLHEDAVPKLLTQGNFTKLFELQERLDILYAILTKLNASYLLTQHNFDQACKHIEFFNEPVMRAIWIDEEANNFLTNLLVRDKFNRIRATIDPTLFVVYSNATSTDDDDIEGPPPTSATRISIDPGVREKLINPTMLRIQRHCITQRRFDILCRAVPSGIDDDQVYLGFLGRSIMLIANWKPIPVSELATIATGYNAQRGLNAVTAFTVSTAATVAAKAPSIATTTTVVSSALSTAAATVPMVATAAVHSPFVERVGLEIRKAAGSTAEYVTNNHPSLAAAATTVYAYTPSPATVAQTASNIVTATKYLFFGNNAVETAERQRAALSEVGTTSLGAAVAAGRYATKIPQ